MRNYLKATSAVALFMAASTSAYAAKFDVPGGDLTQALNAFSQQSGIFLMVSTDAIRGIKTQGVKGELPSEVALAHILKGTGFVPSPDPAGGVSIIRGKQNAPPRSSDEPVARLADAATPAHAAAGVETVVVTSSKIKGDIQTVPIAITALSQEQLTSRQIAGGPDLVKEVPNLTFTKTNFTGYSIQIRGIGTQAISVSTDPAVAVALNDIPFIRNHFFEQEFYDVGQVEVLRGPQGTLYGRNATAGVVNVISAKPTDQFEAMLSADWGNYTNRRYEGMVNIPIVDDRVDLRIAGEWTKRDGYTTNEITGNQVDGRDLWSSRVTLGWKPLPSVQVYAVWEHFSESDDRMRTAKQLCYSDNPTNHPGLLNVLGVPVSEAPPGSPINDAFAVSTSYLSQGCLPASLYAPKSFEVPYGYALPLVVAGWVSHGLDVIDPYASTTQSRNLRDIQTQIDPRYRAINDTMELNADYNVAPALTFTSQTGYNEDYLWSTEDYDRFDTAPDTIIYNPANQTPANMIHPDGDYRCHDGTLEIGADNCDADGHGGSTATGYFCDPQLGCSSRMVVQDISRERAWQLSQEFRLASNFKGPFNFSVGGNYMHYETVEDYYVFANTLTMFSESGDLAPAGWQPGISDNHNCLPGSNAVELDGNTYSDLAEPNGTIGCAAIDTHSLGSVNDDGHNYFLSRNPYVLNSYAGFGEAYYSVLDNLKLTGGIRWTSDHKHFIDIPSETIMYGHGYPSTGTVNQAWNQFTGRFAADWTPKLDFTDQTLLYASYAHGYKAGGANPPGANIFTYNGGGVGGVPIHPLTFKPEFIDAYELGTKNTLLDGGLTLNGDAFFYNYKGYQISRIVDRTAINDNFDATVRGAELEAMYEPIPGLKFNFAGGYEDTRIDNGQSSIDLMDRTAGHPGWMVMKPFVTATSNCVFPDYVVAALITPGGTAGQGNTAVSACQYAYDPGIKLDPVVTGNYYSSWSGADDPSRGLVTGQPYFDTFYISTQHVYHGYPVTINGITYPGFDPLAGTPGDPYTGQNTYNGVDYGPAPNDGEGFAKDLSGHQLPNAPHFTVSLSGEYTLPVSEDWAATFHTDFYWQSQSFARVFNDRPYDKIRGYSNVNLALILTSASGWQVMGYLKNVFDTTAITGTFLNSDDTGLTTNVFLTDPRLFGVRVTKNW